MDRETEAKIKAQAQYCHSKNWPHFAPHTGICFHCGKQIYKEITLERAGSYYITGCPYCCYSYCE